MAAPGQVIRGQIKRDSGRKQRGLCLSNAASQNCASLAFPLFPLGKCWCTKAWCLRHLFTVFFKLRLPREDVFNSDVKWVFWKGRRLSRAGRFGRRLASFLELKVYLMNKRWKLRLVRLGWMTIAGVVAAVPATSVWAQTVSGTPTSPDEAPAPSYVLDVCLLVVLIGAAVFAICRSSRRS